MKKLLQRWGSAVVRRASDTGVPDTTSGFRAYNREAALQIQVVSKFTYTLESIIQAGKMLVAIDHVPIRTNPKTRESRLFPSTGPYVRRNGRLDLPHLRALRAAAPVPGRGGHRGAGRRGHLGALPVVRHPGRQRRPHPVADPRLDAVHRRRASSPRSACSGDILAGSRVLQQRILERVRRVELHLGVEPSHYEPGAGPTGQEATTGAAGRPATGKTEDREALKL